MPSGDGRNSEEDRDDEDDADGSVKRLHKSQLCNPGSVITAKHGGASTSLWRRENFNTAVPQTATSLSAHDRILPWSQWPQPTLVPFLYSE
ncbi:hypothetical protein ElyMa_005342800 [Elysia marginata]|uniref:Uncharacterized protein n=1 Tax=Elysia marginata TaxID=1093978 RepID=A0AAV4E978_9GAST|nr:hypothetical protein ElyMa_005342800 [Elysia marginata]